MSGTSKEDIRNMLKRKDSNNLTHMLVVCDTFSYEDYPVHVSKDENIDEVIAEYSKNMQKVMEIYSYSRDLEEQLNETRAWHPDKNKVGFAGNYQI